MQLLINGEKRELETVSSVQQLLDTLGYESNAIAIAIDGCFVPRHQYSVVALHDNQVLDIVAPMQGG